MDRQRGGLLVAFAGHALETGHGTAKGEGRMKRKHMVATLDFPARKLILGMMAMALTTLFLTSFLQRMASPVQQQTKAKSKADTAMAAVPALMAKLQENPNDEEAILGLADTFMRAKDWQRAEHFYGLAVKLDPKTWVLSFIAPSFMWS